MKKYIIALTILSLCLALVVGTWIGMQLQKEKTENENNISDSISMSVAVVNQDLGTTVGGQAINYANAVIETLGRDYIVVSSSAAQKGLDTGAYGAIVTFPSDFSASIVSINRLQPNQAILDLSINQKLPEERYLILYTQLVNMQRQVNNSIAYAYVETVFDQLHSAQDEISTLLANDELDMQAVKQVALANYSEMLDLGDLPMVSFEPTSPDFAEFMASAQSIADDMNQVYVDSYAEAQKDFAEIKKQIADYENEIVNQSDAWIADMSIWSNDVLNHAQELDEWREKAVYYQNEEVAYVNTINEYVTDMGVYFSTESGNLELSRENLQTWREQVTSK